MQIYIVIGSTGEYSDRTEWLVCGFYEEEQAKARVIECTQEAKIWIAYNDQFITNPGPACDKKMRKDYNGTSYRYEPVEIDTPL